MATRMNPLAGRYFNDPNMATAMSNLASAFAPPSADEALGWAQLQGVNDQNSRLSTLWSAAGNDFDRMGVAAGQWNPSQSYYAVDSDAATRRYGYDTQASTTLATNEADNDRALREAILGYAGDPSGRQGLTEEQLFGITDIPGLSFGTAGPVAPTDAQVQGDLLMDAITDGLVTPADAASAYTSAIPVEQVMGANGPEFARRGNVEGRTPFVNKGAEAAPVAITFERNGVRQGGFVQDGRFVDSNGQALSPQEAGTAARIGQPQGTNAELGVTNSLTTEYRRVKSAAAEVEMVTNEIEGLLNSQGGAAGIVGTVQSAAQNLGQVAREIGMAVEQSGMDSPVTPDMLLSFEQTVSGGPYNPVFQQIRSYLLRLAYANAQISNPGGEVGQIALARELESLGTGLLANDESIRAALSVSRQNAAIRRSSAEALMGNEVVPPTPLAAQNAGAQPPAATPRPRAVNPQTNEAVEWDGTQWVPVQ